MPKVLKIKSLHIFAISPENRGDEVDFLRIVKHESFLQIDTMIFDGYDQAFPNSQNNKFAMSLQYLRKKEMKLIFSMQINIKFPTS